MKRNYSEANKYLLDRVQIPLINERSIIRQIKLAPSPTKNVKVLIGYFEDRVLKGDRLAFIWELTYKGNKISEIRVVYDGANVLVDKFYL